MSYPEEAFLRAALDRYFPPLGQCQICGVPGLDARHRVLDAICDRIRAGEDLFDVVCDYNTDVPAVLVVLACAAIDEARGTWQ